MPFRRSLLTVATGSFVATSMPAPALACLPEGVAVPGRISGAGQQQSPRAVSAAIFLDVSGSMAGYVAPPRTARPPQGSQQQRSTQPANPQTIPEPRAFRDLVISLPRLVSQVSEKVFMFAFGRTIRPIPLNEMPRYSSPQVYRDTESKIGDALARLEALPADEIGILVTDLFLTGEEIFGGAAAIRSPLRTILADGRSVGMMGIRSGFSGTIFDIPIVRTYDGAEERPFYVIVTGQQQVVAHLLRRIELEVLAPLPQTTDGTPRSYSTIYTKTPISSGPLPFDLVPSAPAAGTSSLTPGLGSDVRQFLFPRGNGAVSGSITLAELARGPVLLPDQFQVKETVWAETQARSSCGDRWHIYRNLPGPLTAMRLSTREAIITVGTPGTMVRMLPGVPFLLHAKVTATGISDAPDATAWTRAWNLEDRDAERFAANRPTFFKTLHLREVATMLEGIVREDYRAQPVGEALLAFQVPR
jgi:hypothetical protein